MNRRKDHRAERSARIRSRILRGGIGLAFAGQLLWGPDPSGSQPLLQQQTLGEQLYQGQCLTCHGVDAAGTADGPSLRGVGTASIDFMLRTGRMPLNAPDQQPVRQQPVFSRQEIEAIIVYLAGVASGGPGIPDVDPQRGDLGTGFSLYTGMCSSCHGAGATGDSIGGGQIAPSLYDATATETGEAIRVGPGLMPAFGEGTLDAREVDSIARYLRWLRTSRDPGGLALDRVGAVAEGFVAVVIGLGLLLVFVYLTGTRV